MFMPLRLTCGIFGAALLGGCAGLPGYLKDPDLHLDRVIVRGVGLTGGTMDLIVGVYNPNNFDLNGTKLQVGLDVENSHVGDLEYDDDFQMQKGDTTALTLPVRFDWNGLAGAARSALGYGELPYKLTGQLTIQTPFGDRKVPFTREGRAPLTRAAGLVPIPTGQ
jgi:LEA14-like dessication related protein